MRRNHLTLLILPLLLAACGEAGDDPTKEDAGEPGAELSVPAPDGGALPSADSAPPQPEITPSLDCDQYLSCLAAAQPEIFPAALQIYQPSGPCWESDAAAQNCEKACREGFNKLTRDYWEIPECVPSAGLSLFEGTYRVSVEVEEDLCGIVSSLYYLMGKTCELTVQGTDLTLVCEVFEQEQVIALELQQGVISGVFSFEIPYREECSYQAQVAGEVLNPESFTLTLAGDHSSCSGHCPYRVRLTFEAW